MPLVSPQWLQPKRRISYPLHSPIPNALLWPRPFHPFLRRLTEYKYQNRRILDRSPRRFSPRRTVPDHRDGDFTRRFAEPSRPHKGARSLELPTDDPIEGSLTDLEYVKNLVAKFLSWLRIEMKSSFAFSDMQLDKARFWDCFEQYQSDILYGIQDPDTIDDSKSPRLRDFVNHLIKTWREHHGYVAQQELRKELKKEFYRRVMRIMFTPSHLESHLALTDARYPMEWYQRARGLKRTIHLHVGPTNSGKTYHALKRLQETTGPTLYAGPLRMLAQEVYARMNALGKPTWLVTGDDRQAPTVETDDLDNYTLSCTVEMIPMGGTTFKVAVIDEIQMLASPDRGCHWTAALLGVAASEVHLCGEERAVEIVRQIVSSLGEELIIHRYERLSPLEVMNVPVTSLGHLEKGDCIVCFSIDTIHRMRRRVERITGKRCAIVYGGLPSEVRAEQAALFNDPNNDYDFLVASDAIGMGLNLAVKRMIFQDTLRSSSQGTLQPLTISDVKQIGGRAGRYRTSYQDTNATKLASGSQLDEKVDQLSSEESTAAAVENSVELPVADITDGIPFTNSANSPIDTSIGYVTALKDSDLAYIKHSMYSTADSITKAGLQPTQEVIEQFYSYFPSGTPYSFVLVQLFDICRISDRYYLSEMYDQIGVADAIEPVKALKIKDRITMCFAPVSKKTHSNVLLIREMAHCVANQSSGNLLGMKHLNLDILDVPLDPINLVELENLHKGLVLYCWMSFRFPGVFTDRLLAGQVRTLTEEAINNCLTLFAKRESVTAQDQKFDGTDLVQPYYSRKDPRLLPMIRRLSSERSDPDPTRQYPRNEWHAKPSEGARYGTRMTTPRNNSFIGTHNRPLRRASLHPSTQQEPYKDPFSRPVRSISFLRRKSVGSRERTRRGHLIMVPSKENISKLKVNYFGAAEGKHLELKVRSSNNRAEMVTNR
jgi:ATP-dependent RNA helicase SUPV3L1/SUV3